MKSVLKAIGLSTTVISLFVVSTFGETNLQAGATQPLPKLLDLGAHKCIPCKMMAPILEELTKEYKGRFDVEFIDVWMPENQAKAEAHGIRSIPTQIFFDATGKELWRHEGFISKEDILNKWKALGYDMQAGAGAKSGDTTKIERWQPLAPDTRSKETVCYLSDATIDPQNSVTVSTPQGDIRIKDLHHFFIMYTSLTKDKADVETRAAVTDWKSGQPLKLDQAVYLTGVDESSGRPWIRAFANRQDALETQAKDGGSLIAWDALKQSELSHRCGFCDRACYPQDSAEVLIEGIQSYGCCAHCAMGVAARSGKDIEVRQPDALTGEMIVVKTKDGQIASIEPASSVAWFGKKKTADGKWVSAGCFHQGFFTSVDHLKTWLEQHPLETGEMITIEQSLADKMKLMPEQIAKACKIGECSPK